MPGRWTQYEEDSSRLPEGFKRIGYDADTKIYTFRDANGVMYQGKPGLDYGTLKPKPGTNEVMDHERPSAFESSLLRRSSLSAPDGSPPPKTFQDILGPELITSSTMSGGRVSPPSSPTFKPRAEWIKGVRKSALPKMQGVVHTLRRSMTSVRKARSSSVSSEFRSNSSDPHEDETKGLIRDGSTSTFSLDRPSFTGNSRPGRSPLAPRS
ncbi:hypothetical protein GALMADRAFT_96032 [Galerina marginata CBS 339.88]|uniref:Carbohydrate-binding module family 50 protein n=1 Tax=Galerina marginata (strain CBS 339.88) TaxID=685588 RepID=A0A067T2A9_GALM3|nr:hypothetical protein GALMADRAFT_96032 [Galerina marginata CBS 339.88]